MAITALVTRILKLPFLSSWVERHDFHRSTAKRLEPLAGECPRLSHLRRQPSGCLGRFPLKLRHEKWMFYEEKSHPKKKRFRVDMFEGFWKTNLKDQGWFYTLFKLDFNSKQWTWRKKKWAATFRKRLSSILHIALGANPHCQVTEHLQEGFHHFFLRLWFQAQLLGLGPCEQPPNLERKSGVSFILAISSPKV